MTTIYLTRHGETDENAHKILQGLLPTLLNAKGIAQAHDLKEKLRNTHFDAILCSDQIRSIDTAKIVAEPHSLEPVSIALLRERDWGSWSGAYIPDILGKDFPSDVETVEAMFERSHRFIQYAIESFPYQTILVVGHGMIDRTILAALENKTIKEIPPFTNTEVRIIHLSAKDESYGYNLKDTQADN